MYALEVVRCARYEFSAPTRQSEPHEGVPPKYQDVFGETLLELARSNPKIVALYLRGQDTGSPAAVVWPHRVLYGHMLSARTMSIWRSMASCRPWRDRRQMSRHGLPGKGKNPDWKVPMKAIAIGKGERLQDGSDVAVLSIGPMANISFMYGIGVHAAHFHQFRNFAVWDK